MRRLVAVVLAFVVVVVGAAAIGPVEDLSAGPGPDLGDPDRTPTPPLTPGGEPTATPAPSTPAPATPGPTATPSGDREDVIGWENGVWYNASLDINTRDGLDDAELDLVVARSMARVELIRGLEFRDPVTVEVISREEHQRRTANSTELGPWTPEEAQNEQVWEALYIVGEDADVRAEFAALSGSNVLGYYDPTGKKLVLVSPDPNRLVVDPDTLAHELVHALQDQYFDLAASAKNATVQDTQLARNGVIEGEANYVAARYMAHCETDWQCLDKPRQSGGAGPVNLGVLVVVFQPYSDGPVYVDGLVEWRGWEAVNEAHRDLPQSSEAIIHSTTEAPEYVRVVDRSQGEWKRIPAGGDVLGEASIYTMFWTQARTNGAETVDTAEFFTVENEYDTYDYVAPPSAGWGGDRLVAYENGDDYGYVWVTKWDSEADAIEFQDAYLRLLAGFNAESVGDNSYVISDGAFADAFRVTREGRTVTIVNGPTVASLAEIDCVDCAGD